MSKTFSQASERNRGPILEVLRQAFADVDRVLEVGCGTGQHAAWFATHLAHLEWLPSDRSGCLDSVRAWRADVDAPNLLEPIELDLLADDWQVPVEVDAIFAANVIHIAPWEATGQLFDLASRVLPSGGLVYLYGPFRYAERTLEPSNERFDRWLKARDPNSGIRQFEDVDALAHDSGFKLIEDRPMPANNRSIWWQKSG